MASLLSYNIRNRIIEDIASSNPLDNRKDSSLHPDECIAFFNKNLPLDYKKSDMTAMVLLDFMFKYAPIEIWGEDFPKLGKSFYSFSVINGFELWNADVDKICSFRLIDIDHGTNESAYSERLAYIRGYEYYRIYNSANLNDAIEFYENANHKSKTVDVIFQNGRQSDLELASGNQIDVLGDKLKL